MIMSLLQINLKLCMNLVVNYEEDNLGSETDSDSENEDIEDIIKSFKKILRTPQGYREKKIKNFLSLV